MNLNDVIRFVSKLSLHKVQNALAIVLSYYRSKRTGKPEMSGLPFTVSIEPTTSCNLGCPECPSGLKSFTRPTGFLEEDLYYRMIDELHPTLLYAYFYFQGEPYLHPKFTDIVRYAQEKNIYTVTSTNAHFLTKRRAEETVKSGLDRVIVSVDGTTQEVYEQYRKGGSLHKVLEGIAHLVEAKKQLKSRSPHIVLQFLVVKPNEHQVPEIFKLGKKLGVNEVKLKTAQVYDYENGNPLIPENEKYTRYQKGKDGKYSIKNALLNHCWKMWHSCVITWDGRVVPCCFDKDANWKMGDLKETGFKQIWYGAAYEAFRTRLMKGRKEIDICANCSEGTKVWA